MDEVFFYTDDLTGIKRKLKLVFPNVNTKKHILQEYINFEDTGRCRWVQIDMDKMLKDKWDKTVFERQMLIEKFLLFEKTDKKQ